MRTVSLKLPLELDRALTDLAVRQHSSRSELLREAVVQLTQQQRRSVGALAADLAGCVEGPEDLSYSSEHMAGYGA